jgi:hypothetical protein
MDSAKKQLVERLKSATNVLVTVSRNPSVDQLAACIGLTLLLNKQGKHAAAVFSGEVPSTLEFLQPEETLEKNTDSLRDFIISLDKSKADKLRYKVEDNIVRIFITPYKTSISQADLEFSEGDFNVDVVVALGVKQQEDLDEAITAHGRILHDATVASINTSPDAGLGSINWADPQASSLSELVTDMVQLLGADLLDKQIATALLTGIVAETNRFSNDKTSSQTMSASAALMTAGANQQLVASQLQEGGSSVIDASAPPADKPAADKGTLQIDHADETMPADVPEPPPAPPSEPVSEPDEPPVPPNTTSGVSPGARLMTEPPTLGGTLTANSRQEQLDPTSDPMSLPATDRPQLMDHKPSTVPTTSPAPESRPAPLAPPVPTPPPAMTPPPPSWTPPAAPALPSTPPPSPPSPAPEPPAPDTLSDLEKSVDSPHTQAETLDTARSQVDQAIRAAGSDNPVADEPIQALNAQPLGGELHIDENGIPSNSTTDTPKPEPPKVDDPTAPPPVPPPIPFDFTPPKNP